MSITLGHAAIMEKAARRRETLIKLEELLNKLPEVADQLKAHMPYLTALLYVIREVNSDAELVNTLPNELRHKLANNRINEFSLSLKWTSNGTDYGILPLASTVDLLKT